MRSPIHSLLVLTALALAAPTARLCGQAAGWSPLLRDLTIANGEELTSTSIAVLRTRDILPGRRIRVGLGLRGTFVSGAQKLTPAGAKNVPVGVIDTLALSTAALMLNVAGHFGIVLTSRLEAGLNIDLAGFGAGGSRVGSYKASAGTTATSVDAAPTSTNLFLYGSKDRGSLNSEFFAAWKVTDLYTVRTGLSHQLTEYRADRVLTSNTDRFRHYANLIFVGVRIGR